MKNKKQKENKVLLRTAVLLDKNLFITKHFISLKSNIEHANNELYKQINFCNKKSKKVKRY